MATAIASTFSPINGNSTYQYAVTSTSSNNAFPSFTDPNSQAVRITSLMFYNEGLATCYVTFGSAAATVPTSSVPGGIPLAPGAYVLLNSENTSFSAICAGSGSATLDVTYGQGE